MTDFFGAGDGIQSRAGGGVTLLILDKFAIEQIVHGPSGMVWRWTNGLGREVSELAKVLLEAHTDKRWSKGTLRDSTTWATVPWIGGWQANVLAKAKHAMWFIRGTLPHIEGGPDYPEDYMRFFWFNAGRRVETPMVNHPGYTGYNYLDEAKIDVLVQRGII